MKSTLAPTRDRRGLIPIALTCALVLCAASCAGSSSESSGKPVLRVLDNADNSTTLGLNSIEGDQLRAMANLRFERKADLALLDGPSPAYIIEKATPPADQVQNLMSIFGIDGPLDPQPAQVGGGYAAGSIDGSGPSFRVTGDALLYWTYSVPLAPLPPDPNCVESPEIVSVAPPTPVTDSIVVSDTDAPQPAPDETIPTSDTSCTAEGTPTDVPSNDAARQMFLQLMSDIGIDTNSLDIEVFSDSYGASVTGFLRIGGVRSPLSWNVGYGQSGQIQWAGGTLAQVKKLVDYPRIGTTEGLDRLNEEQSSQLRGATDGAPHDLGASSGSPTDETLVEIVTVEEELIMLYGVDGSAYLVPGYAFLAAPDDMGYEPRYTVSAMPEKFTEFVETPSADSGQISGVVDGSDVEMSPDTGPSGEPMDAISRDEANTLVGMTEAEATSAAKSKKWVVRIAARDGEQFALTMDYNPKRVNLTVDNGVVTYVFVG